MIQIILDIVVIIIGVLIAESFYEFIKMLYNRYQYKELREIECDLCEEPKKLYKTPDKYYYLCKSCMEAYLENPEFSFSEVEKERVRKKYKVSKAVKRVERHKKRGRK